MEIKGRIRFSAILVSAALWVTGSAQASLLGLKQVQISDGSQVDILFDGKVSKSQLRTEFFNDIIQISLTDTAVYPAKISSVNGPILTKIFAYQYAPKLVRCRLTVKGKAEAFKDHVKVIPNGSILTVRFDDKLVNEALLSASDRISMTKAAPRAVSEPKVVTKPVPKPAPKTAPELDSDERSLLERVLKAEDKPTEKRIEKIVIDKPVEKPVQKSVEKEKAQTPMTRPLAGNSKPLMSPLKVMGKMSILIGLLLAALIGFKKLMKGNSALSKLAKSSIGKKKMIEVLSTHHLGPKKSIAVVKIAGRMLVLGIANESINLIAQLNSGESPSTLDLSELEDLGLGGIPAVTPAPMKAAVSAPILTNNSPPLQKQDADIFAKFLDSEASKPAIYSPTVNPSALKNPVSRTAAPNSVRAQIRNRLEGLKQL